MGRISAFIVGGAIGAGLALAFAPKTGEQTRALVAEKANAFAGEAKDFGAGFPESAQDAYKAARERGEAFLKDAQGTATGFVKEATGATNDVDSDELRQKIEAARQRIAAQVMENAEKAKEAAEQVDAVADAVEDAVDEAKHAAN